MMKQVAANTSGYPSLLGRTTSLVVAVIAGVFLLHAVYVYSTARAEITAGIEQDVTPAVKVPLDEATNLPAWVLECVEMPIGDRFRETFGRRCKDVVHAGANAWAIFHFKLGLDLTKFKCVST